MASGDFAFVRNILARGEVKQVGTDTPVAIRLRYVGTGTVTSVVVTTATNIVLTTSDGGVDTYAFNTLNTVGKVVDAINADGIFEAKVLDSVRSYATASQFVTGAVASSTYEGKTVWDVKVDTSAAKYFAYRLTLDRGFDKNSVKKNHRVHLQEFVYFATLGNAAMGGAQVYECTPDGTETSVLSDLSVSASLTTTNFASGRGKMTAADGNDLVVVLIDSATLGDAAANLLRVVGSIE